MDTVVDRRRLIAAVDIIKKTHRRAAPIQLTAENGHLQIFAPPTPPYSRDAVQVSIKIGAEIAETGYCHVELGAFRNILSADKAQTVRLQANSDVQLATDNGSYSVPTYADIGEPLQVPDDLIGVEVPFDQFAAAVSAVGPIVNRYDQSPVLQGCLIEYNAKNREARLVGTDRYRLAFYRLDPSPFALSGDWSCVVPLSALVALARSKIDCEYVAILSSRDGKTFVLRTWAAEIVGAVPKGIFPEYHAVIPLEPTDAVSCDRGQLLQHLKLAAKLLEDPPAVNIELGPNTLKLAYEPVQASPTLQNIVATGQGRSRTIKINAKYVIDAITPIKAHSVQLEYLMPDDEDVKERHNPADLALVCRSEDRRYYHFVMPMYDPS